jgi:hypothetical protein
MEAERCLQARIVAAAEDKTASLRARLTDAATLR